MLSTNEDKLPFIRQLPRCPTKGNGAHAAPVAPAPLMKNFSDHSKSELSIYFKTPQISLNIPILLLDSPKFSFASLDIFLESFSWRVFLFFYVNFIFKDFFTQFKGPVKRG